MSSNTKYNGERISGISKGQTQEAPFGYAFTFNGAQGPPFNYSFIFFIELKDLLSAMRLLLKVFKDHPSVMHLFFYRAQGPASGHELRSVGAFGNLLICQFTNSPIYQLTDSLFFHLTKQPFNFFLCTAQLLPA